MVWWVAGAVGIFYLLFAKTAPKASDVFKKETAQPDAGTGSVDVPVSRGGKRRAGTKPTTVADFAGVQYDPTKNPWRNGSPAVTPKADEVHREELPSGSLDDVADDIEVSVDGDVPDPDLDGEMDSDPDNQY